MKKLFINLTMVIFSLSLFAKEGLSVNKPNSIITDIDWSMHPRYVPVSFTNATEVVTGYDRISHRYLDEYVNPKAYGVTLRVILKNQKTQDQISYRWEIEGITKDDQTRNDYHYTITTGKKCLFAGSATVNDVGSDCETIHLFPCTGAYKIRITASVSGSKETSIYE